MVKKKILPSWKIKDGQLYCHCWQKFWMVNKNNEPKLLRGGKGKHAIKRPINSSWRPPHLLDDDGAGVGRSSLPSTLRPRCTLARFQHLLQRRPRPRSPTILVNRVDNDKWLKRNIVYKTQTQQNIKTELEELINWSRNKDKTLAKTKKIASRTSKLQERINPFESK